MPLCSIAWTSSNSPTPRKMAKQFTLEEINKHTDEEDCWIVIHGNVYNVTDFLDSHPGGPEYLTDFSGCESPAAYTDDLSNLIYLLDLQQRTPPSSALVLECSSRVVSPSRLRFPQV